MTSTVWPNRRQGIITMLRCVIVGPFCEPIWGFRKKVKLPPQVPKGASAEFSTFPVFGGWKSDCHPSYNDMTVFHSGAPKYWLCLVSKLPWLSLTTSWLPSYLMLDAGYSETDREAMGVGGVRIFLLTPTRDCMIKYISDWTQKWNPALMIGTVWPVGPPRWPGIAHVL